MAINSNFRTLTADNIEGVVAPRNYLKNSFENGTTAGWTEMAVTLTSGLPTGTPTINSTAAASIALSNTTTTPLSLSRSLLVTGAAGWTAGQGFISDEFTIDRMDGGKPLTVSFDYERVSGTLNFSGTLGSQTLMVYIYDATAGGASWIQPAGYLGMNQSSGPGRVTATFQSSVVAGQKYRVAVIASQAVGSACSLEFDNFTCSRVNAPIGPIATDWELLPQTITISGSISNPVKGTVVTDRIYRRRVGDSANLRYNYRQSAASANGGSGNYLFSLPSGMSFDASKVNITGNLDNVVGTFSGRYGGGIDQYAGYCIAVSSTQFIVYFQFQREGGTQNAGILGSGLGNLGSVGDMIFLMDITAPIAGWSSSVQQSSDTDTRVVALSLSNGTSTAALSLTPVLCPFSNIIDDTHGAWSTVSNLYTIPVSGRYKITFQPLFNIATGSPTCQVNSIITVDAASVSATRSPVVSNGQFLQNPCVYEANFRAGQTVGFYANFATAGAHAGTFYNDPLYSKAFIERLSGPSVVAASESVNFVRRSASGQQVNSAISTYVDLPISDIDSHNAWVSASGVYNPATGTWSVQNPGYRIPVSGTYLVSGASGFLAAVFNSSICAVNLLKNGSSFATGTSVSSASGSQYVTGATCLVKCNAGDFISLSVFQDTGASRNIQNYGSERTYMSITRIGN